MALDVCDFVLLEEKLNALAHSLSHPAAALDHGRQIGFGLPYFDAVAFGMLQVLEHLPAFEQRFGGDTAPVEAYTHVWPRRIRRARFR